MEVPKWICCLLYTVRKWSTPILCQGQQKLCELDEHAADDKSDWSCTKWTIHEKKTSTSNTEQLRNKMLLCGLENTGFLFSGLPWQFSKSLNII